MPFDPVEEAPNEINGQEPPFLTCSAETALYKGLASAEGFDLYLNTTNGPKRVGAVGQDFTIHCPEDNAGHGRTYAAHADTTLYLVTS